ncbi:hypothetical protein SNEBB_007194 [Seison nebaliae]|nr:hypothetical protein SNEBB_007194 [Seison nebaliae]
MNDTISTVINDDTIGEIPMSRPMPLTASDYTSIFTTLAFSIILAVVLIVFIEWKKKQKCQKQKMTSMSMSPSPNNGMDKKK